MNATSTESEFPFKAVYTCSGIYKICTNPGAPQAEILFFRLRGLLISHVESIYEVSYTERYKSTCYS